MQNPFHPCIPISHSLPFIPGIVCFIPGKALIWRHGGSHYERIFPPSRPPTATARARCIDHQTNVWTTGTCPEDAGLLSMWPRPFPNELSISAVVADYLKGPGFKRTDGFGCVCGARACTYSPSPRSPLPAPLSLLTTRVILATGE